MSWSSPNIHYLTGSPAEAPARLEWLAAEARRAHRDGELPLSAGARRILQQTEHVLETEAALMVADAILADAEVA